MTIVLSSSDARPQYARDVLTVLAAPEGVGVQFRYSKTYVAADLKSLIARGQVNGEIAVVVFVGKVASDRAHLLPIRMVKIVDVTDEGDAYIVRFVVQKYVDLRDWQSERVAIMERGRSILQAAYAKYDSPPVAAWGDHGDLPVAAAGADTASWKEVADRLAALETYSESYLARMWITNANGKTLSVRGEGSLDIRYRRKFLVNCYYTRASEPTQGHTVRVTADDKIFDFPSEAQRSISTRYDKVEFPLYAKPMMQKYERDVVIDIAGIDERNYDFQTRVNLPVTARRPVIPRVLQWAISAMGAGLVATPALLGAGAQLEHKLLFAALGAAIVATVTVFGDAFTGMRS